MELAPCNKYTFQGSLNTGKMNLTWYPENESGYSEILPARFEGYLNLWLSFSAMLDQKMCGQKCMVAYGDFNRNIESI